jgi:hypothetical protein
VAITQVEVAVQVETKIIQEVEELEERAAVVLAPECVPLLQPI